MVMPYVTDTHTLIWYMTDDPNLSIKAKRIFKKVDNIQEHVFIPVLSFLNYSILLKRKRSVLILTAFLQWYLLRTTI